MRRSLVSGNWKMNGTRAQAQALLAALERALQGFDAADVAVCPPFVLIPLVAAQLGERARIAWGGQDLCEHEAAGAYTGEVSGAMLKDAGCTYAIVGHSERRALYGESDEIVAMKFKAAQAASLTPILCVGEQLAEREANRTEEVVARQLDAVVAAAGIAAFGRAVIAYEPVWAIGTGRNATPEQAQAVHRFIRARLAQKDAAVAAGVRILYGGSVKGNNAAALFAQADIDGGLIGGASLNADEFAAICRAAT